MKLLIDKIVDNLNERQFPGLAKVDCRNLWSNNDCSQISRLNSKDIIYLTYQNNYEIYISISDICLVFILIKIKSYNDVLWP